MNKLIVCALACCLPLLVSATEIVAPNVEPGHWVTTTDTSAIIERALALVPEANRAMVRKMMEGKLQESSTTEQCITEAELTNLDERIESAFGDRDECKYNIDESTSDKFVATLNCPESELHITTNFIDAKRNESTLVTNVTGIDETTITSVSVWQSSTCPAGL